MSPFLVSFLDSPACPGGDSWVSLGRAGRALGLNPALSLPLAPGERSASAGRAFKRLMAACGFVGYWHHHCVVETRNQFCCDETVKNRSSQPLLSKEIVQHPGCVSFSVCTGYAVYMRYVAILLCISFYFRGNFSF